MYTYVYVKPKYTNFTNIIVNKSIYILLLLLSSSYYIQYMTRIIE